MEIIFGFFGIIIVLALIGAAVEALNEWQQSINWGSFFGVLIIGGAALAMLFSFTAEGVLVIIGAYIVLIFGALIFGSFKK